MSPFAAVAKSLYLRATLHWRASKAVLKLASQDGYVINLKELRTTLRSGTVHRALFMRRPDLVASAVEELDRVRLHVEDGTYIHDGQLLFRLAQNAYVRSHQPSDAVLISQHEISSQLSEFRALVVQQHNGDFDENLRTFPPGRADVARIIWQTAPAEMERIIAAIVAAPNRADLLTEWEITPPSWVGSVPEIWGWLGELGISLGVPTAAAAFLEIAVDQGISPRGYWKFRRISCGAPQTEEEALAYLSDSRDYPLVRAIIVVGSTAEQRRAYLDGWIATTQEQSTMKSVLQAQFARDDGRLSDAIRLGLASYAERRSTGGALVAAHAMLIRSNSHESAFFPRDVSDALAISLKARDDLRSWHVSSGAATLMAMKAAMQLMDVERALALSQVAPEGEATEAESGHSEVRDLAILLLAQRGFLPKALKMVEENGASLKTRREVQAIQAELDGDTSRANELWSQAVSATKDWNEKAALCFQLATRGVLDPFVNQLRPDNPAVAAEMSVIAELFARRPGSEQKARMQSRTNPRVALSYIKFLEDDRRFLDQVGALKNAAKRWNDPDLWLKAARTSQTLGNYDEAKSCAQQAHLSATASWGGTFDAHVVMTEACSALGEWDEAIRNAIELNQIHPDDSATVWAVVGAIFWSGDQDRALETWENGPRPRPNNTRDASIWMTMFRVYGSRFGTVTEALEIIEQFKDDEQVRRLGVGAVMLAPNTDKAEDANPWLLAQHYVDDFPDSRAFVSINVGQDGIEALRGKLDAVIGQRSDLSELESMLHEGVVPIGLLSRFTGRSFALTLIRWRQNGRFVGPRPGTDENAAIRSAIARTVVIDTTALYSLALLAEEISVSLMGEMQSIVASTEQLTDAYASRENLSYTAGATLVPKSESEPSRFEVDSPVDVERMRVHSERLVAQFELTQRVPRPSKPSILSDDFSSMEVGAWSAALDIAAERQLPFWCDDAATRVVAEGKGIPAFGTAALLEFLQVDGDTSDTSRVGLATLVRNFGIGIPFSPEVYDFALQLDGNRPLGTAMAIRFGEASDIEPRVRMAFRAMANESHSPDSLAAWAASVAVAIGKVSDAPGDKVDNYAILTRRILTQSWASASTISWAFRGIKSVADGSWPAVLSKGAQSALSDIAFGSDHSTAASFLHGLIGELDDDDRASVLEVILAP